MTEPAITSGVIIAVIGVIGIWIKEFFAYKKRKKGVGNPINLDRFYQEFKDFKDTQEKWNDRIQGEIDDLEKMRHPGK